MHNARMPRDPDRRNTIINGATDLFLQHGYDGVSVDEICKLTSSSKGSFYHFFRSKEDLAIQIVDTVWEQNQARMAQTFNREIDPAERIRNELRLSTRTTSEGLPGCPIGALSAAFGNNHDRINKRLNFALTDMRQFYLEAFNDLKRRDGETAYSPAQRADLMQSTIQGISVLARATGNANRIRQMVRNVTPFLLG